MSALGKDWMKKAKLRSREYVRFLQKLQGKKANRVLKQLPAFHQEAFSCISCRKCANCCKTISPRFKTPDIRRISKYLHLRESQLIDQFLKLDEDGDYVVKSSPCPFLGADNGCTIYESRPGDCRQYPYTDSDVFVRRPRITGQNASVCPAVYYVLEKLMNQP
jgi:Fe-S-cluster containining protein